jgi:Zn-dependent protease
MNFDWYQIVISIIPILFAITVHEYAHGWMAKRCGDNTAFAEGRLTLNPINHIDPVGTIVFPLLSLMLGGFLFGWAKPVPVHFGRLRNIKVDGIKVALAGPVSNLIMAFGWSIIIAFFMITDQSFGDALPLSKGMIDMAYVGISFNLILFVFNLLPIPPLDGGRILQFGLPTKWALKLDFFEQYGMFIVMGLAISGILWKIIGPITSWIEPIFMLPSVFALFILQMMA